MFSRIFGLLIGLWFLSAQPFTLRMVLLSALIASGVALVVQIGSLAILKKLGRAHPFPVSSFRVFLWGSGGLLVGLLIWRSEYFWEASLRAGDYNPMTLGATYWKPCLIVIAAVAILHLFDALVQVFWHRHSSDRSSPE